MVQTLSPPSRSDVNTTDLPSGEKRGCASYIMPFVNCVAVPPAMGSVYRSPRRSKTIDRPSGLTSSEIQVPSSVSRLKLRVLTSDRSGRAVAWAWSAEPHRPAARMDAMNERMGITERLPVVGSGRNYAPARPAAATWPRYAPPHQSSCYRFTCHPAPEGDLVRQMPQRKQKSRRLRVIGVVTLVAAVALIAWPAPLPDVADAPAGAQRFAW